MLHQLKTVSIPRLGLTAAVLASRVDSMLKAELKINLEKTVFWTDSTTVLKYVNNEGRRFHAFVANRISIIREISEPSQWRYVSTKDNPADDASKETRTSDFLKNSRWLRGPEFLWEDEEDWPKTVFDMTVDSNDEEVKTEITANAIRDAWLTKLRGVLLKRSLRKKQLDSGLCPGNVMSTDKLQIITASKSCA